MSSDDIVELLPAVGCGVAVVIAGLFLGSCVQDYAKSAPHVIDVLVTDKDYRAPYTTTSCSGKPITCSTTYHPPSWSVEYADEERHWMNVSQGTHDALRIGDKKVLRYDLGGGYWHARYNERFEFGPLVAEGSWPAR